MPSRNTYGLTWVSLTLDVGCLFTATSSKAQLLPLTLDEQYLLMAAPPDLACGVALLCPPAQPPLLGCGVAPLRKCLRPFKYDSIFGMIECFFKNMENILIEI